MSDTTTTSSSTPPTKKKGCIFFALILLLGILGLLFYFFMQSKQKQDRADSPATSPTPATTTVSTEPAPVVTEPAPVAPSAPAETAAAIVPPSYKTPATFADAFQQALAKGEGAAFLDAYGDNLDPAQFAALANFKDGLSLRQVGVLEFGKKSRWAIAQPDGTEVQIDVLKLPDGTFKVSAVNLPQATSVEGPSKDDDALTTADDFIRKLLTQQFEPALAYVDSTTIAEAQIAGLCIMFEEGQYALNDRTPLSALFLRDGASAFAVNLIEAGSNQKGQLELAVTRESKEQPWKVSELNMEGLIRSYIARVAGGDAQYTPLIKNPQGGDRLALYFDFNDGDLTPRAKKQLDIIAALLKSSRAKKLTLSGHADALGSDSYNRQLSFARAESVKAYLQAQGIQDSQIAVTAYGESMPRSSNDTDQGRRANRRTEIYLDF